MRTRLPGRLAALLAGGLLTAVGATVASRSFAQRVSTDHATTLVLGPSPAAAGGAVTERIDGRRSGATTARLPAGPLRVVWSRQLRAALHPPLVTEDGTVIAVTEGGEADFLNPDGTDLGRLTLGPGPTSAPSLLADGTLVVVTALGEGVGVRRLEVAFRTPLADSVNLTEDVLGVQVHAAAHGRRPPHRGQFPVRDPLPPTRSWTLPLDDGGAVLAFEHDLVSLDAAGTLRSRVTVPAAIATPLVAMPRSVAFASETGEVFEWDLASGDGSLRSRGSFGGPIEGSLAALDARHLIGVVRGARLVTFDLPTGITETRATATGAFTGAFALTRTAGAAQPTAFVQEVTAAGAQVLAVEPDGRATPFSLALTPLGALSLSDAGTPSLLGPTETHLFADGSGALAYATLDGHVGVLSRDEKHELGPMPCGAPFTMAPRFAAQGRTMIGFAGLVPAGQGGFVVACEDGAIALVRGLDLAIP